MATQTDDIDREAVRLTELAAVSVRALEERKPGCAETNNIGLLGAIRSALIAERERCAKIAETYSDDVLVFVDRPGGPPGNFYRKATKRDIADAIRRDTSESQ